MAFFSMIKVLLLCTTTLSLLLTTPASGQFTNYLLSGQRLRASNFLHDDFYQFVMQSDCNLVLYEFGQPKWASNTNNKGSDCYLQLERDGSLVIYDAENKVVWEIGIDGTNGSYTLLLQRDGNVVIYGPSVWATGTASSGSNNVVVSTALNGKMGVSGKEKNKVRKMGKIMEVVGDE